MDKVVFCAKTTGYLISSIIFFFGEALAFFFIGWGIFLYSKNSFTIEEVGSTGNLLVPYFSIMAFIAAVFLIVRTEDGEKLHQNYMPNP